MLSAISIGLQNPKSAVNVATILRAAGCFGVSSVFYTGERFSYAKQFSADTKAFHKVIPTVAVQSLQEAKPKGSTVVGVELVEGATPLPAFKHPDNAFYVFGPEDGSMSEAHLAMCDEVVYIPTFSSLNLAVTANIVLYDRLSKSAYDTSVDGIRNSRDTNNRLSLP